MNAYCIFYEEKVKRGRYIIWLKKVLIATKRGKILYDGEIVANHKLESLLKKFLTKEQKIKYKDWISMLKIY